MKNSILILGCVGMVMVLSGCPIWLETEEVDTPDCGWGCSVECYDSSDCGDGYLCNASGLCVPEPEGPIACAEDVECLYGYCDLDTGFCVETGVCSEPEDCLYYGPGLTCDDRGICVPDEGPCPDGECGCVDDDECADGQYCIGSRCTDPEAICIFDFECGTGTCLDTECHADCQATNGVCPVGQQCSEMGLCVDLEVGTDGCVFDEDCGDTGFKCINATCHPTCTDGGEECADGEACLSGACRADVSPIHECTADGTECAEGMTCLRGKCRMPCVAPVNCADQNVMTECDLELGVCRSEAEMASDCIRSSDCATGASCFDGQCAFSDL